MVVQRGLVVGSVYLRISWSVYMSAPPSQVSLFLVLNGPGKDGQGNRKLERENIV